MSLPSKRLQRLPRRLSKLRLSEGRHSKIGAAEHDFSPRFTLDAVLVRLGVANAGGALLPAVAQAQFAKA